MEKLGSCHGNSWKNQRAWHFLCACVCVWVCVLSELCEDTSGIYSFWCNNYFLFGCWGRDFPLSAHVLYMIVSLNMYVSSGMSPPVLKGVCVLQLCAILWLIIWLGCLFVLQYLWLSYSHDLQVQKLTSSYSVLIRYLYHMTKWPIKFVFQCVAFSVEELRSCSLFKAQIQQWF